ncbi:MAG: PH domain-containing protein [Actinomycetota bacterium]|nr:PH domain-containing protein [Actinomycetota bacterium]
MSAIALERYLAHDERVVLLVRRHLALLARPASAAVVVIVGAAVAGTIWSPTAGNDLVDKILGLVALVFVLRLAWKLCIWWADRIVVTDQRIFEVSGVLSRKVQSMPIVKVTDMTYHRSLLGRMFGYGDLVVEAPGQTDALRVLSYLPQPDDFYRTITTIVTAGLEPLVEQHDDLRDDQNDTGPLPRVIV